jgi:hypothetical protein
LLLLLWHKQQFRFKGKLKADFVRRFLYKLKTEQAEITDDGGYFQYRQCWGYALFSAAQFREFLL